jgi:hypothetical protein
MGMAHQALDFGRQLMGETALGETALGETALGETALGETALGETAQCTTGNAAGLGGECEAHRLTASAEWSSRNTQPKRV